MQGPSTQYVRQIGRGGLSIPDKGSEGGLSKSGCPNNKFVKFCSLACLANKPILKAVTFLYSSILSWWGFRWPRKGVKRTSPAPLHLDNIYNVLHGPAGRIPVDPSGCRLRGLRKCVLQARVHVYIYTGGIKWRDLTAGTPHSAVSPVPIPFAFYPSREYMQYARVSGRITI